MEICKLRALRKLAHFILEQYNCDAQIHIHAQTTLVNKTNIDIYNNLLRSTTETMSASIGGANSIVVFPFIKEDADKLIADFKDGKLILVGVNKFQNKLEEPKTTVASHIENVTQSLAIQPIKALRLA